MLLHNGKKRKIRLNPKRADGSPGRIDGSVTWGVKAHDDGSPAINITFEPAFVNDDETQGQDPTATFVRAPADEFGTEQVTGTADVDLGAGPDRIENITGVLDVLVPEEGAAFFEIAPEGGELD